MDMFHYGLGHKLIPFLEAVKLPEAKAAVNKEWDKLKTPTCSGRKEREARPKGEERRKDNSLFEPPGSLSSEDRRTCKHPSTMQGVKCSGETVKEECGYRAVVALQGASMPQTAAGKFLDTTSNFLGMWTNVGRLLKVTTPKSQT